MSTSSPRPPARSTRAASASAPASRRSSWSSRSACPLPWLAVLVGLNLAISAAFGTRFFLPGRLWPVVRRTLRLGPAELEHEYPPASPRRSGATFIGLGAVAFAAGAPRSAGSWSERWPPSRSLLAATGICVGCRLYVLRWWVPTLFARLFRRADRLAGPSIIPPISYRER